MIFRLVCSLTLFLVLAGLPASLRAQEGSSLAIALDLPGALTPGVIPLTGWAADLASPVGTGVDSVRIYLDGPQESTGTALGTASYGQPRPDVAAALGAPKFVSSGFSLRWDASGLSPGDHTIFVYAHSAAGWSYQSFLVTLAAGPAATPPGAGPIVTLDSPGPGARVSGPFQVAGWAVDPGGGPGPGIDQVLVFWGPRESGALLGQAIYGLPRPDVAATLGDPALALSGFSLPLEASQLPPGPALLYAYARGRSGWGNQGVNVLIAPTLAVSPPSLAMGSAGSDSVSLTWSAGPGPAPEAYNLYQSSDSQTYSQVRSAPGASSSATITGLRSGATYQFYATAVAGGQESAPSNVVSATTAVAVVPSPVPRGYDWSNCPPGYPYPLTFPELPGYPSYPYCYPGGYYGYGLLTLTVTSTSYGEVVLSWTDIIPVPTMSYTVYQSPYAGPIPYSPQPALPDDQGFLTLFQSPEAQPFPQDQGPSYYPPYPPSYPPYRSGYVAVKTVPSSQSSTRISGLAAGTQYSFYITAQGFSGQLIGTSNTVTAYVSGPRVRAIQLTITPLPIMSPGGSAYRLDWVAPGLVGVSSWSVYQRDCLWGPLPLDPTTAPIRACTSSFRVIRSLPAGITSITVNIPIDFAASYSEFYVTAVDAFGQEIAASNTVSTRNPAIMNDPRPPVLAALPDRPSP